MEAQKNIRVLIVEDEAMIAEMIQAVLKEAGYVVVGRAVDGVQAVEMTQSLRPDVVLMDIALPGMDGLEAARRIYETRPTPVVVLTAYETPELVERASAVGVGAYLIKPPKVRDMERAISISLARFSDLVTLRRLNAELQVEVAERKAAEENLGRMIKRFDLAARAARLGVWDWDVQKNQLAWDDRMYELYGVKEQDFSGAYEAWVKGLHPDDAARSVQESQQALRGEKEYDTEFRVVWPDGAVRTLKAYGQVVRDSDGRPLRMTGINDDITERKQAEEALLQSNELLSLFMKHSPIYTFIKEVTPTESRVLMASENYQDMIGIQGSEMVGKTMDELFPPELAAKFTADDWLVVSRGQVLKLDEDAYGRNFTSIKFPIFMEGKTLLAGYTIDITERKQAEEALRESEERYRTLIEKSSDAQLIIDDSGHYADCNQAALDLLRVTSREQLLGLRPIDLSPERQPDGQLSLEKSEAMIAEILAKGSHRFEWLHRKADGKVFSADIVATAIKYHGKTLLHGVWRDITERKRAEDEIRQLNAELEQRVEERTAELSQANVGLARAARLKDEFLAAMSHELRTPLTAILGMSESLQEGTYGPLNEKQLKSLRTVETSGRHLLALITDILDLAKIGAGKVELQIEPASVESVCQASLQFVKQDAHKHHLQVSFSLDTAVTTIQVDARRLKQILVNLLNNAVKFTPDGGKIGLEVEGDAAQGVVRLTVWDTGIGIAEQDLGKLFQQFVQLDASLARQYAGTGLGLALVKGLTEMHGGSVAVESELGQGSRFTVSLPWQQVSGTLWPGNQGAEEPLHSVTLLLGRPVKVLLAEDNESNLSVMADYLQSKDYTVVMAEDGRQAVERAKAERPDIIIMDVQMPGMDGLEAIHRIRAEADLVAVPIIAITGLAMPGDDVLCLEAGANDYLAKPVSLKVMLSTMQALLKPATANR